MPAPTVLHYIGANDDRGGIVSVVRGLATAQRFECVLGVNRGFVPRRSPRLPVVEMPPLAGEELGVRTFWRARLVARAAAEWLAADRARIFHGHSRAGLAVALRLRALGERRVVVSMHCYGRQRWFYRWAARRLGPCLFWLSPAMKGYYGVPDGDGWAQCIPGCVPLAGATPAPRQFVPGGTLHLGGAGMLVEWKRWHLVLAALARLPAAVRARVRFAHIGATIDERSSRYADSLRASTVELGLADRVEWRGEQPGTAALLQEIHCLVVASWREPLSVAMLEALRAGVPVLASESGGNTDVVRPPRNGWFFRPDDPADLAGQIARLVETDALAQIAIGPEDIARFDAHAVAAQWAQVYARLTAASAARSAASTA